MIRCHAISQQERLEIEHKAGPLEIGRGPKRQVPRLIVPDPYVSKDHVRIEEMAASRIRIENLSQRNPIWLSARYSP